MQNYTFYNTLYFYILQFSFTNIQKNCTTYFHLHYLCVTIQNQFIIRK